MNDLHGAGQTSPCRPEIMGTEQRIPGSSIEQQTPWASSHFGLDAVPPHSDLDPVNLTVITEVKHENIDSEPAHLTPINPTTLADVKREWNENSFMDSSPQQNFTDRQLYRNRYYDRQIDSHSNTFQQSDVYPNHVFQPPVTTNPCSTVWTPFPVIHIMPKHDDVHVSQTSQPVVRLKRIETFTCPKCNWITHLQSSLNTHVEKCAKKLAVKRHSEKINKLKCKRARIYSEYDKLGSQKTSQEQELARNKRRMHVVSPGYCLESSGESDELESSAESDELESIPESDQLESSPESDQLESSPESDKECTITNMNTVEFNKSIQRSSSLITNSLRQKVSNYRCQTCNQTFVSADELSMHTIKEHIKIVSPPIRFNSESEEEFTKGILKSSELNKTQSLTPVTNCLKKMVNNYECSTCKEMFPTLDELKKHKNDIHNEYNQCHICKKKFTHAWRLQAHMVVHQGQRLETIKSRNVHQHLETIKSGNVHRCLETIKSGNVHRCLESIKSGNVHEETLIKCDSLVLSETFSNLDNSEQQKTPNSVNRKTFQLQDSIRVIYAKCQEKFSRSWNSTEHDGDEYECQVCSKKFMHAWRFAAHMAVHRIKIVMENITSESGHVSESSSENVPKNSSENTPGNTPKNSSENSSENTPKNTPENSSENTPENEPETESENSSRNSSENEPENIEMDLQDWYSAGHLPKPKRNRMKYAVKTKNQNFVETKRNPKIFALKGGPVFRHKLVFDSKRKGIDGSTIDLT